jgi:tRNA (uracil-5-)-methyltransferase
MPYCHVGPKRCLWTYACRHYKVRAILHLLQSLIDFRRTIYSFKKGASLLLRDSLATSENIDRSAPVEQHVCVTDHNATVREKVGDMFFEYKAGSFFQNNNSILVSLASCVRDAIFSPSPSTLVPTPTHLIDAYCGSGFFAIMLSPRFSAVAGIELSTDSVRFATHNAGLNDLPEGKCTFRAGDAANIFATVKDFPPDHTVLVIDPPRKGCDDNFIEQVLAFGCRTVVYVSCNVHTQARDVGRMVKGVDGHPTKYVLESVRGIDLFPQTAHVESVALLRRM